MIRDFTKDQATITWSAPKQDGGAPVSSYRLEMRSAGAYRCVPQQRICVMVLCDRNDRFPSSGLFKIGFQFVEMSRSVCTCRWEPVVPAERITDTSYTVRTLAEETDYEFRVMAENRAGLSAPSEVSKSAKYCNGLLLITLQSAI